MAKNNSLSLYYDKEGIVRIFDNPFFILCNHELCRDMIF
jgi:hypothetical protein